VKVGEFLLYWLPIEQLVNILQPASFI
jgi:hypothetical protein